jgi:hypothetical protein
MNEEARKPPTPPPPFEDGLTRRLSMCHNLYLERLKTRGILGGSRCPSYSEPLLSVVTKVWEGRLDVHRRADEFIHSKPINLEEAHLVRGS